MTPFGVLGCVYAPSGAFLEARLPTPQLVPFLSPVPCPGDVSSAFSALAELDVSNLEPTKSSLIYGLLGLKRAILASDPNDI